MGIRYNKIRSLLSRISHGGDMDTGSTGAALGLFPAGNSFQCGAHLRGHSQEEAAGSSPLQPQVSQAVHTPFKNI